MPGVLGAPPGVTFSNTRSITTNGLTDDVGDVIPGGSPGLVNPKKRRNHHPRTNGLKNGLSSQNKNTGGLDDDLDDDDEDDEEVKAIKKEARDFMKEAKAASDAIEEFNKAKADQEAEDEKARLAEAAAEAERKAAEEKARLAEAAAEAQRKAEEERKAKADEAEKRRLADEKKAKEEAEERAKNANSDKPTKGKDDTTGHLLNYNDAREKVRHDLEDFKTSLDRILELLSSHVHPEDWANIFIHNQSARQYNASIGDRNETRLMPLRNAKGLVTDSGCTIIELEGKSNAEKETLLKDLGSQHKFEFNSSGDNEAVRFAQHSKSLTKQVRVAVGLPANYTP